jgi:tetratricopeptide (TPR) repeat protein
MALLEAHRASEALALLEVLSKTHADSFEVHLHLARAHHASGARQEAVIAFKRAAHIQPDNPLPWIGIGVAYGLMNRHEQAIDALRKAMALGDDSGQAHLNLGRALAIVGRGEEAVQTARAARDRLPYSDVAAYGVCLALMTWAKDSNNADAVATSAQAEQALSGFIAAFPGSPLQEEARDELARFAARKQDGRGEALPRADVLAALHEALQIFDELHAAAGSRAAIGPVVFEVLMLLQSGGLDAGDADARYTLDSLPGRSFNRTQLMACLFAGAKRLTIAVDAGIDFEREYELALQQRQSQGKPRPY